MIICFIYIKTHVLAMKVEGIFKKEIIRGRVKGKI